MSTVKATLIDVYRESNDGKSIVAYLYELDTPMNMYSYAGSTRFSLQVAGARMVWVRVWSSDRPRSLPYMALFAHHDQRRRDAAVSGPAVHTSVTRFGADPVRFLNFHGIEVEAP